MTQRYAFRDIPVKISNKSKLDPQAIGEGLEALAKDITTISPEQLIEAAKPKKSVFHDAFEWNDTVAAHRFRIEQARSLLASIGTITYEEDEPEQEFFSVKLPDEPRTYYTRDAVESSYELQDAALAAAERDMESFIKRYRQFENICEMATAVRDAIKAARAGTPGDRPQEEARATA
jgi:hypothetical protein